MIWIINWGKNKVMGEKKSNIILDFLAYIILVGAVLITLFPILYAFLGSLKSTVEIMTDPAKLFPSKLTFESYIQAFGNTQTNFARATFNSIVYTGCSVFANVMISLMAGYTYARGVFRGKKLIFGVFSAMMFINFGAITVHGTFKILKVVHLNQNIWGLILLKCFSLSIANVYIVRSFVEKIPKAIDESAMLDGCSFAGIFFKIMPHLLKPVIATIALISFNASWNDYLMPSIFTLTKPEQRTLTVLIMSMRNAGDAATNWNQMLAGACIAMLPTLLIYGFANKHFVKGLSAGAVKG